MVEVIDMISGLLIERAGALALKQGNRRIFLIFDFEVGMVTNREKKEEYVKGFPIEYEV